MAGLWLGAALRDLALRVVATLLVVIALGISGLLALLVIAVVG